MVQENIVQEKTRVEHLMTLSLSIVYFLHTTHETVSPIKHGQILEVHRHRLSPIEPVPGYGLTSARDKEVTLSSSTSFFNVFTHLLTLYEDDT